MSNIEFSAEEPLNYEQKTLCCVVVDVSGSMNGSPIAALNQGLQTFYQDIHSDSSTARRLEVAVIAFNSTVDMVIAPSLIDGFQMPMLHADGSTKLVDGVREGIRVVQERKNWYRSSGQPYLRPWIVLITDGSPDSDQDVDGLAREIYQGVDGKHFVFFALGVASADMHMLRRISSPSMPPAMLDGIRFKDFFQWLSASMSKVSQSKSGDTIAFNQPTWMQGFTIH